MKRISSFDSYYNTNYYHGHTSTTEYLASKKLQNLFSSIRITIPLASILINKLKLENKLRNRLENANLKIKPVEFMGIKLFTTIILGILAFFVFNKFDPLVIMTGLLLGFILPDLWLAQKVAQRREMIIRRLPETIDLLGLCIEGGLDFVSAIKWIAQETKPTPLLEELTKVLEEIKWGKSRAQALKDMAKRLNIPQVSSFVQTLVQSERMGTPISEVFAVLSEDNRLQRFHQGERYAMRAPIKILFPLIFCILPVIGIIIGGPIFLQFMQGNLWKGLR